MFVQTEITPNPNSLKFLPEKKVSNSGPYEITKKDNVQNELVRNILSINGVKGVFLGEDFISVNKDDLTKWDDLKHIVISFINDFYSEGKEFVIDESLEEQNSNLDDLEQKIVKILDEKIRPAVARDGGDNKFLTSVFWVTSLLVISYGPLLDTFFPGRNLSELGFGVTSVWTNMNYI